MGKSISSAQKAIKFELSETGLRLAQVLHFALREEKGLGHMPPNNFSATGITSDAILGACMDIPVEKSKLRSYVQSLQATK